MFCVINIAVTANVVSLVIIGTSQIKSAEESVVVVGFTKEVCVCEHLYKE